MNWGDTLCGKIVTPKSWLGGVTEVAWGGIPTGRWALKAGDAGGKQYCRDNWLPIFPPKGWAGKTDAELWAEVFGMALLAIFDGWTMNREGIIQIDQYGLSNGGLHIDDAPAAILALQNAQVLAARLNEVTP